MVVTVALATAGHAVRLDAQSPARDVRVILLTPRPSPASPGEADRAFATLAAGVTDTLVLAAYGLDRTPVVEALIAAQARLGTPGAVRVVVDNGTQGAALAANGISVTARVGGALMHDKFAVFGRRVVWTGSANATTTSLARSFENVVIITSTTLADAYRAEFDLMHARKLFSTRKPPRTPVHAVTDAGEVDAAFSPSGGAEALIVHHLDAARSSIDVAANELTRVELAHPLATAAARGVQVRVLYDDGHQATDSRSAQALLCAAGASVLEEKATGTLHHKVAIIDRPDTTGGAEPPPPANRPVVLTGSANWTDRGLERNDENVVAIQSAEIAAVFGRNFDALWAGAQGKPPANLCAALGLTATPTSTPSGSPSPTPTDPSSPPATPTESPTRELIALYLPALESSSPTQAAYPYP